MSYFLRHKKIRHHFRVLNIFKASEIAGSVLSFSPISNQNIFKIIGLLKDGSIQWRSKVPNSTIGSSVGHIEYTGFGQK